MYLSNVKAWNSANWEPYGGEQARHGALKPETDEKHHENAPARDLA